MRGNGVALTAAQMKQCDAYTIREMGVPSMVLMERAALAAVDEILSGSDPAFDASYVLCVCGAGNNGGDGVAVARLLSLAGARAEILFVGARTEASVETAQQLRIAENYGVRLIENPASADLPLLLAQSGVTTIVDALFGIGLSRPVCGLHAEVIRACNASPARVLSVDIPSGVSADTGAVMGVAIRADKTVVLAFQKIGLTLEPGKGLAGRTAVRDIGIGPQALVRQGVSRPSNGSSNGLLL
ncbi:MAG: NAD(P)H-hydrate epimerase [Clostridiales Family XIII bacterium]|jgi:NAD(P)H-hydrate epimerase|nr:NAD(P)H-hydrate epimerase [Clostridiales Family XIII bacterium]